MNGKNIFVKLLVRKMDKVTKIKKMFKLVVDSDFRFEFLSNKGFYNQIDDEEFSKRKFKYIFNRELNLDNPTTYNEKIQWLKLNDRNKYYTMLVDKYSVREEIKKIIGEEFLIPLLGVWENANDIEFDKLPNQFVLKCTHNSGKGMCVCTDKNNLNIREVIKKLNKGLKENYYLKSREWPYKYVKPRIIAEQFIGEKDRTPNDYKFFIIEGKIECIMVCSDRDTGKTNFSYYDIKWNDYSNEKNENKIQKPKMLDEMISITNKIIKGLPSIHTYRIDLYNVKNKIYFGEITFYNDGGFDDDITKETDELMGSKVKLW